MPGAAEIGFAGTFVENATKANPTVTTESIDEFFVWGIIENEDGLVFTDEKVWKAGDWTYANTQYWVPGHNYYFSAIAGDRTGDQIVIRTAANEGMNTAGLGTVTFTNKEGMNDVLYAEYACTTPSEITAQPEDVKFQFAHLLSKVKFTFQNGFVNEHNTVVVKNIKMTVPNKGVIDLTQDAFAWTNLEGQTVLEMGHMAQGANVEIGEKASSDNELLTIPAAATQEYTVTFDVELWMGDVQASTAVKTVKINGYALEPGKAYNFTAIINEQNVDENPLFPITFDAEVVEWVYEQHPEVTYPIEGIVRTQDELDAALKAGARIFIAEGEYTLTKCPAGVTLIGVDEGVVLNVEGKKFGVHGDVTVENAKLLFSNENYTGFQHTNVEVYKNCTIVGQPFLYGNDVTFQSCTFEQTSANAYNVWTYGAKNVKFTDCTFNCAGKSVLIYTESGDGQNVTFTDCVLNASARVDGKAAIEIDSSLIKGEYDVNINNTTANGFGTGNVSGISLWNNKKGNKTNITVDGVIVLAANSVLVEDATKLQETLTSDAKEINVTLSDNLTYYVAAWANDAMGGTSTEVITIDLNGKTLTFNQTNSDWNNIVTNAAKLVIKNGHITNAGHNDGPWNRHDLNFACPVELVNVTSDKALAFKSDATLTNVTIADANTSDTYAIWVQPKGQTIILDGCTIDMLACTDGRGLKIDNQYLSAADEAKVTLKVSNTVFKTEEKSAILVKTTAGAAITLSNVDITDVKADNVNHVWVDSATAAYADKVIVTGGKVIVEQ